MSKPVKGDPSVDIELRQFGEEALRIGKKVANGDLATLRNLARRLGALKLLVDDAVLTKMLQRVGGHMGAERKRKMKW